MTLAIQSINHGHLKCHFRQGYYNYTLMLKYGIFSLKKSSIYARFKTTNASKTPTHICGKRHIANLRYAVSNPVLTACCYIVTLLFYVGLPKPSLFLRYCTTEPRFFIRCVEAPHRTKENCLSMVVGDGALDVPPVCKFHFTNRRLCGKLKIVR